MDGHTFNCYLQKADGGMWDMAMVGDASISMTKNAATTFNLKLYRDEVTSENYETLVLLIDGTPFIWGYVVKTSKSQKFVSVSAIDQIHYLAKNSRTQNYGELTASDFIKRLLDDLGAVTVGDIEDTGFKLPEIIMQATVALDAIVDAINKTFEGSGKKFFLYDDCHKLCLSSQESLRVPESELNITHANCKSYTYDEDATDVYTAVKGTTQTEKEDENKSVVKRNEEAIERYGLMQKEITVQDGANLDTAVENTLSSNSNVKIALSATVLTGSTQVRAGSLVHVDFYTNGEADQREFIKGWFQVDSVTHKLSLGIHEMDLNLSLVEMEADW